MPIRPSPEEIAKWDRWFAIESNNQTWDLVETEDLTSAQREAMLHSAHAAASHWGRIGTEVNQARADMLLALVHARLRSGSFAMVYARRSLDFFNSRECPDWEIALAHAVLASAAHAAADASLHAEQYALAKKLGDAIANSDDKDVFTRTFGQIPKPGADRGDRD
jgi:hypothetical protein